MEPSEPDPEPSDESDEPVSPEGFVPIGLLFYGAMAIAAVVWRVGLYREDILYAGSEPHLSFWRDAAIGLGFGLAVVGLSDRITRRTRWGDALARALASSLGRLSVPDALLLAFASGLAEELFFRGALQPRVGWLLASLLFGCVHFVPRRELYPWTAFAIVVGLGLGALFELTGNLVAPVVAHVVVNGINLPLLTRRYGTPERGR